MWWNLDNPFRAMPNPIICRNAIILIYKLILIEWHFRNSSFPMQDCPKLIQFDYV
jgi:hypothetical protein